MHPVSQVVRVSLPNYLASLPVPDNFVGWFKLGVKDWIKLVPFFATVGGISFAVYKTFLSKEHINPAIRKEEPKVADIVPIESLGEKTAFCRCWRSEKWPFCDGKHSVHNKATGDNVGPVVITRK